MRRLSAVVISLGLVSSVAHAGLGEAPIIGGTSTTVGEFPSVVVLEVGNGLCSGTLIDSEWVVTAAHCLTASLLGLSTQDQVTSSTRVHLGTVDLTQSAGTTIRAAETFPNPSFNINDLGHSDVGLIHLATPVTNIAPTPVNLVAASAPVGITVSMVGFGATQQNAGGTVGIEFSLDGRTSVSCSSFGVSDANLLCFTQTDNKGKCEGDSGGPSFAPIGGRTMLVGITSFGDQSCAQFGADTRTDAERAFLLAHIPTLEGCTTDAECGGGLCFNKKCIVQPFTTTGLGATCTGGGDCESGQCAAADGEMLCTEICTAGAAGTCPDGFDCLASGATGVCWPSGSDGGCCDSGGNGAPTMLFGIALVGLVLRNRRRR
jgi:hypothetical protein